MTTSLEQALLYFVDLRLQLRGEGAARDIIDRCLRLLAEARDADAETLKTLEAEIDVLRADLERLFGTVPPLKVH